MGCATCGKRHRYKPIVATSAKQSTGSANVHTPRYKLPKRRNTKTTLEDKDIKEQDE